MEAADFVIPSRGFAEDVAAVGHDLEPLLCSEAGSFIAGIHLQMAGGRRL